MSEGDMTEVGIEVFEMWPAYKVLPKGKGEQYLPGEYMPAPNQYPVPQETAERWLRIQREYDLMREEVSRVVNPRCPECDHPIARHQMHSPEWHSWGCLDWFYDEQGLRTKRCRCQHGIPDNICRKCAGENGNHIKWCPTLDRGDSDE